MFRGTDSRGQSITLDYTLALSIGFLLITGLVVGGSDFFSNQRDQAQRAELNVIGQQVASELAAADRLMQATEANGTVRIERRFPDDVARSAYRIEVLADEDPSLLLQAVDSTIQVRVDLVNETAIAGSTVPGGDLVINHTASEELRVEKGESYA